MFCHSSEPPPLPPFFKAEVIGIKKVSFVFPIAEALDLVSASELKISESS